jgi:hypothetical protein
MDHVLDLFVQARHQGEHLTFFTLFSQRTDIITERSIGEFIIPAAITLIRADF